MNDDSPRVSPALRLLAGPRCAECGSPRVRLAGVAMSGEPGWFGGFFPCVDNDPALEGWLEVKGEREFLPVAARVVVTVLCGDCWHIAERHGWSPNV